MSIEVTLNVRLDSVHKKLSEGNHQAGMESMAEQALADMNNYVPLRDSELRQSGHVEMDGANPKLVWQTPYAMAQFTGIINGGVATNYTTPGTGPQWDLVAKGNHFKDWKEAYIQGGGFK